MPSSALTSAEISLPSTADAARVRERIAVLADTVDVVGLTDNHAGESRMSPLAAVALAREQGVKTVVHVSCRDRNRLALQSQVVGAAALGSEGVLCLYGDPVEGVARVKDLTTTTLIAAAKQWAAPEELAVGAVVNPFAPDIDRELRLLERKVDAGVDFVQSQMVFDRSAFVARKSLFSAAIWLRTWASDTFCALSRQTTCTITLIVAIGSVATLRSVFRIAAVFASSWNRRARNDGNISSSRMWFAIVPHLRDSAGSARFARAASPMSA